MFGGAAEAVAAAKTLTAAIPAAPMAVLTVVVANFTMGSFVFSVSFERLPRCRGQTALIWHSQATATSNVTASRNAMSGLANCAKRADILLRRNMVRTTS